MHRKITERKRPKQITIMNAKVVGSLQVTFIYYYTSQFINIKCILHS